MRIVNVDSFFTEATGYSQELSAFTAIGAQLDLLRLSTEEELAEGCCDADVILVEHPSTPFTARVIESLEKCRLIAKYAVGLDNIDLPAATRSGIVVCHAPDYCAEEVSDHALALLFACARRIAQFDRHVRGGGWFDLPLPTPLRRLSTQTLGLVGFGRIARLVARKVKGFGIRTLAYDPLIPAAVFAAAGVQSVSLEELLGASDFLSLHLPLTQATRGLIGAEQLARMRPTAFLINTSRGGIVDEAALVDALGSGRIAGAGLDVAAVEPPPAGHPLRTLPNVVLTPHFAARSEEAIEHLRCTIIRSVTALHAGYWPPFPANPQVAPRIPLRPWLEWSGREAKA